jgi:hypothetical protein
MHVIIAKNRHALVGQRPRFAAGTDRWRRWRWRSKLGQPALLALFALAVELSGPRSNLGQEGSAFGFAVNRVNNARQMLQVRVYKLT